MWVVGNKLHNLRYIQILFKHIPDHPRALFKSLTPSMSNRNSDYPNSARIMYHLPLRFTVNHSEDQDKHSISWKEFSLG